jgi:hypothetical protein
MNRVDRVTNELRSALIAYTQLDAHGTARAVVALFGLGQSKRLAPLLDEIARNVQQVHR